MYDELIKTLRCQAYMCPSECKYEKICEDKCEKAADTIELLQKQLEAAGDIMAEIADGHRCEYCKFEPNTCDNGQVYACANFEWRGK